MTEDQMIISDLMKKAGDDMSRILMQTLRLVPQKSRLPIAMAAGAAVVGILGGLLDTAEAPLNEPDPECIMLAGLLLACAGIGVGDPIEKAYEQFEILKTAGALKSAVRK